MTPKKFPRILTACAAVLLSVPTGQGAEAPTLKLGEKGKVLLEETFTGEALPKDWTANTGKLRVTEGSLRASELAKDMHAGAFRYRLPVQDVAVQLDFRFDGARMMNLGFDPAPGELKKKGHLYSVILTPDSWQLTEHVDKANPASKNKVLAKEGLARMFLHAWRLAFRHPSSGATVALEAPLPAELAGYLQTLEQGEAVGA